jgi:hypothetical protein
MKKPNALLRVGILSAIVLIFGIAVFASFNGRGAAPVGPAAVSEKPNSECGDCPSKSAASVQPVAVSEKKVDCGDCPMTGEVKNASAEAKPKECGDCPVTKDAGTLAVSPDAKKSGECSGN